MAKLEWTRGARDDLESLDRPIQKRVLKKLSWFQENFEYLTPKPLSGKLRDFYKLRIGDWRIVYDVSGGNKIVIRAIGHRSDIYEQ